MLMAAHRTLEGFLVMLYLYTIPFHDVMYEYTKYIVITTYMFVYNQCRRSCSKTSTPTSSLS